MSSQHGIHSQGLPSPPSTTGRRKAGTSAPAKYPCRMPPCNKVFKKKFNRKIHEHSMAAVRKYRCDICHERFQQMANITRHKEKLHHIPCGYCGEVFTNKWDIPAHCAVVHPDREPVQRTVRNFKASCKHGLTFHTCEERNRHENACAEIKRNRKIFRGLYGSVAANDTCADMVDDDDDSGDDDDNSNDDDNDNDCDMNDDDDHSEFRAAPAAPAATLVARPPKLDMQKMSSVSTDSEGSLRIDRMGSSQDYTDFGKLSIMHEKPKTKRMSSSPPDGFACYTPSSSGRDALSVPPPAPRSAAVVQAATSDFDTHMASAVVDTGMDAAMSSAVTTESFRVCTGLPSYVRQNSTCASEVAPLFKQSSVSPPVC